MITEWVDLFEEDKDTADERHLKAEIAAGQLRVAFDDEGFSNRRQSNEKKFSYAVETDSWFAAFFDTDTGKLSQEDEQLALNLVMLKYGGGG